MITAAELNRLQDASVANPDAEPEFFRALLDATLYTHAPLHDDSPRLRFVMFSHPFDHALTIPVFTDEAKATFAARGKVRIVSMPGRLLFQATNGASLTINPNDTWCTLYPEEISELLATGNVGKRQPMASCDALAWCATRWAAGCRCRELGWSAAASARR